MNRNRRLTRLRSLALAGAAAGVVGVAAAPATALATPTISISGATASYPLVSLLAAKYVKLKPHTVKFKIAQGGAQIGINDVAASRVSIGDVSRDPLPTDPPGLVFYPIAKYGICVVTNKANTLGNLTPAQVVSIFTGKTRNWSQVPGASASGTIDLISRTSVAGVLTSFQTLLLEGKKVTSRSPPNGPPRVCFARRSKTTRTGSDSCPTTRPGWANGQLGQLQRRGLQQVDRAASGSTPASRGSTR